MKQEKFDKLWEEIESNFDWERVYQVMKTLDWVWHIHSENYGIPDIKTIKKSAKKRLFDVWNSGEKEFHSSSGGFRASRYGDDLRLVFEVTEWDTNKD